MVEYEAQKEKAKQLFLSQSYTAAYDAYKACLDVCAFKDQLVTLYSNMAMCAIKLFRYEQAFLDCECALERARTADVDPILMIKLRYRLALCLTYISDYEGASKVLNELKKHCNVHE